MQEKNKIDCKKILSFDLPNHNMHDVGGNKEFEKTFGGMESEEWETVQVFVRF